jgi:hypothetical protein
MANTSTVLTFKYLNSKFVPSLQYTKHNKYQDGPGKKSVFFIDIFNPF